MTYSGTYDQFTWTKQKKLNSEGHEKLVNKKFGEAEKLLLKALKAEDDNPIDRHFVYNNLIEFYYKLRNERKDALEKCIYYCRDDIDRLPEFLEVYKKVYGDVPECPSIDRLAIIYEKNEKFQDAIDLCNLAIRLGLEARWEWYSKQYGKNKGYKARIKRLEKKMNLKK